MEFKKIDGKVVSEFDQKAYFFIRENINNFLEENARYYDKKDLLVLDIAPQIYNGAKEYFRCSKIETLDYEASSLATYIADITKRNESIPSERFDLIVCTEVLEHTLNPFDAIKEIYRLLKNNGVLLLSVPFNFRIHGPLPDCWRFTEFGIKVLLDSFSEIEINSLETENRDLMPLHYTIKAIK